MNTTVIKSIVKTINLDFKKLKSLDNNDICV